MATRSFYAKLSDDELGYVTQMEARDHANALALEALRADLETARAALVTRDAEHSREQIEHRQAENALVARLSSQTAAARTANGKLLQVVKALRRLHTVMSIIPGQDIPDRFLAAVTKGLTEAGEVLSLCVGIE